MLQSRQVAMNATSLAEAAVAMAKEMADKSAAAYQAKVSLNENLK